MARFLHVLADGGISVLAVGFLVCERLGRLLKMGELNMGLCYYTTHTSHTSVMEPDHVVPSKDKQNDAAHGPGWYLTDLGPAACEKTLMCHCWPRTGSEQRVRQYVEVEIDGGCALKLRKHVYFVPESSASHLHLISQGQVLECTLKPCEACPLNPEKR